MVTVEQVMACWQIVGLTMVPRFAEKSVRVSGDDYNSTNMLYRLREGMRVEGRGVQWPVLVHCTVGQWLILSRDWTDKVHYACRESS